MIVDYYESFAKTHQGGTDYAVIAGVLGIRKLARLCVPEAVDIARAQGIRGRF